MLNKIKNFVVAEEGQGLSEYGLLLAGIVVVVIAAVAVLGDGISEFLGNVIEDLKSGTTSGKTS
ncbi:Flp family type IVb pilin [Gottfriedia acidiceleris]|uniref:Flp family type IVb pilin n=1 Tax=Gottfriedia acidiceleris TaxID=371036 RepID=UPI00101C88C3|nr:Flp family type IVb pilin [Gottfriedia acidiceleris]